MNTTTAANSEWTLTSLSGPWLSEFALALIETNLLYARMLRGLS